MSTLVMAEKAGVACMAAETLTSQGARKKSARYVATPEKILEVDGSYVGHIEEAILPNADDSEVGVRKHTQRIAEVMERYIARYPEQWCMLQPLRPMG